MPIKVTSPKVIAEITSARQQEKVKVTAQEPLLNILQEIIDCWEAGTELAESIEQAKKIIATLKK